MFQVRIDEPVSFYDLTGLDRHRLAKHWPGISKGVKLAPLSTGIDVCRKLSQKLLVKLSTCELGGELSGIDASQHGA